MTDRDAKEMKMSSIWIWVCALVLYGVFSLWYNNWRGPLTHAEIASHTERFEAGGADPELIASLRKFLETDDGGEFYMVNLIRLHPGEVAMPDTGERRPAREVLERYTGYFMPQVFKRAGHPALLGQAAGGYLDRANVEANPGWSFAGVVRYRSRRDMVELATNPAFRPAHAFKMAAMANTLAFPIAPPVMFVGPRVWVALVLALLASLVQIATNAGRSG